LPTIAHCDVIADAWMVGVCVGIPAEVIVNPND